MEQEVPQQGMARDEKGAMPARPTGVLRDQVEAWIDLGFYLAADPHVDGLLSSALPQDRLLGARALRNLGADRAGDAYTLLTGRLHRAHVPSQTALLRTVLGRRGPYLAWRLMQRASLPADALAIDRAERLSFQMRVASALRDFETVDRLRSEVRELCDDDAWLWVEWSYCCSDRDDLPAALAAAEQALTLRPQLRSATQWYAAMLRRANRRDEAEALLQERFDACECAGYGWQLYALQEEAQSLDAAQVTLARIERLQPRADVAARSRMAARRCDLAMRCGDLDAAREAVGQVVRSPFYVRIAERLQAPEARPHRVELAVPWVRQHWLTCAPATLSALSHWWQRPVDHLELAQAICYDGTSWLAERRWASDSGYAVREFSVDWPTSCALIDAGLPFTLSSRSGDLGHLQAVVGYDALRRTLLVRDPMDPDQVEFDADAAIELWRADGPRGMVIVPQEQAHLLDHIALPDAAAWDAYSAVMAALDRHDRDGALAAMAHLQQRHGDSLHHLRAARSIALYDGDENAVLTWTERLLERFPDDQAWCLSKAASLWAIGGRDRHLRWLEDLAGRPTADATMLVRYADRLGEDVRRRSEALQLVRRALRRAPHLDQAWAQWAILLWDLGDRDAALPAFRAAATLQETSEDRAAQYARVCRVAGQPEQAVEHLRRRVARLGSRSSGPVRSLFAELEAQSRTQDGFAELDAALRLRPDDAPLAAFVAEAHLRYGRTDAAEAALQRAQAGAIAQAALLKARAMLAEHQLDFPLALDSVRKAAALEPLNVELRRLAAKLLERSHGRDEAVRWLREVAELYPNHVAMQRLLYDWLPDDPEVINRQLAHMAAIQPDDAWVLRERAVQCVHQRRLDEAIEHAQAAAQRSGGTSACRGILGWARLERSGYAAGLDDLRAAVEGDVDNTFAVRQLISQAPDAEAARAGLTLVAQELHRQSLIGDGVLTWQAWAQDWLPPDEVLTVLAGLARRHPGAWQVPVAEALQLVAAHRWSDALATLDRAASAFGLVSRVHLERAAVLRLLQRRTEAVVALQAALALDPTGNRAVRMLVDIVAETDRNWGPAEAALQRALALAPSDADLRGLLGWVHHLAGRYEEALEALQTSLAMDAEPEWIWNTVGRCADDLGQPGRRLEMVAALEAMRPHDAWVRLARARFSHDAAAGLRAAEDAVALRPRLTAAWHAQFDLMMKLGRHAEVRQRAQHLPWPDGGPVELRAWDARAQRESGEKASAVDTLQRLLHAQPGDWSCWRMLADWHDEDDAHDGYLQAARHMLLLGPSNAQSHLYVGHALLKSGRGAEALAPLRRALEIDPQYGFAGLRLADAAIACGEPTLALAPLEALWQLRPTLDLAVSGVQVAMACRDTAKVQAWLQRAVEVDLLDHEKVTALLAQVREAGFGAQIEPVQWQALQAGSCAVGAGLDWLDQQASRLGEPAAWRELNRAMDISQGVALPLAAGRWLLLRRDARRYEGFVDQWAERLRSEPLTWGEVSYGLLQFGRDAAVCRWLADWRARPDAPNWLLTNLCVALARGGQFAEAATVADEVRVRDPFDVDAMLWQCLQLGLVAPVERLMPDLDHLARQPLADWMPPYVDVLRGWVQAAQTGECGAAISAVRALRRAGGSPDQRFFADRIRDRLLRDCTPQPWLKVWRALQMTL